MNEDYLWNREGEDAEIAKLESVLSPLAYRPKPSHRRRYWIPASIAAGLLIASAAWWLRPPSGPLTAWTVTVEGQQSRAIRQGEWIPTSGSGVTVASEGVGRVEVEANTRLRLVESRDRRQRFDLQRGVIHALIWAPPAEFAIDTPSARSVDLGCRYTLEVGDDGTGRLSVEHGWVAFQAGPRESFIPAGAACTTKKRTGPGTPYFADAQPEFRQALAEFDQRPGTGISVLLDKARPKDGLSLWHLLSRTDSGQRRAVFTRFKRLVARAAPIEESAILRGDRAALDAAWNALQLGPTDWWRTWKRNW